MKTENQFREDIVRYGRTVYERGYVAAMDGNISVRLDEDRILVTPTCICKGEMEADDLVVVDNAGRKLSGKREVSSELGMHLLIYGERPEIHGIVHAHPPTATGFAVAGIALDQPLLSEVVLTLGSVPLARYATPGSKALSDAMRPLVADHYAILMANHGVVAFAETLDRAFMHMETVEHFAKIVLVTRTLGAQNLLTDQDVQELTAIRQKLEARMGAAAGNNGSPRVRQPEPTKR